MTQIDPSVNRSFEKEHPFVTLLSSIWLHKRLYQLNENPCWSLKQNEDVSEQLSTEGAPVPLAYPQTVPCPQTLGHRAPRSGRSGHSRSALLHSKGDVEAGLRDFSATGSSPEMFLRYLGFALAVEFAACACMYLMTGTHQVVSEAEQQINKVWLHDSPTMKIR